MAKLLGCAEVSHSQIHALTSLATSSKANLWDMQIGHFHPQGLRRMIYHEVVKGLPQMQISNLPCSSCLQGKHSCKKIPKVHTSETTSILQLVHSDVAGPFRTQSLGGAHYFLTFIDDLLFDYKSSMFRKIWNFSSRS